MPRRLSMVLLALVLIVATGCTAAPTALPTAETISSPSATPVPDTATPDTAQAAAARPTATAVSTSAASTAEDEVERPAGWGEDSHGNDVEPNYAVVFPQDHVNEITITIAPDDWEAMQADITALLGERNQGAEAEQQAGAAPGQPPTQGEAPQPPDMPDTEENAATATEDAAEQPADLAAAGPRGGGPGMMPGGGGGMGGGLDMLSENPMWVPATITFNGQTWTQVGVRYKGNSSLRSSWNSGTLKLPLKFDFDEFEDDYPAIENQRFYGFKQLSFANGFGDDSYLRDALAADLLERAGLPAAKTAHYQVYLDYGEGVVDLGLYTAIEVVDDTVVPRFFGSDDGNIYEAEGTAASLATGTADQIADSFQKENNEDAADWSDIQALYDALHAESRTTDAAAWRADLEAVFDVDGFLEWLAIAGVLQHWDAYGSMAHNYYLYHNPATEQLTWISWDHNQVLGGSGGMGGGRGRPADMSTAVEGEAPATPEDGEAITEGAEGAMPAGPGGMRGGPGGGQMPPAADGQEAAADGQMPGGGGMPGGGMGGGGMGGMRSASLDRADVGENWPLIRYLLDDPVYWEAYVGHVQETLTLFDPDEMAARYDEMAAVLAPYIPEDETETFAAAIATLKERTQTQYEAAESFLAEQ